MQNNGAPEARFRARPDQSGMAFRGSTPASAIRALDVAIAPSRTCPLARSPKRLTNVSERWDAASMARRHFRGRHRTPEKFPTATGGIARLAYQHAKAMGIDATPLLDHAKLTLQQVADDRIRVPVKAQIEFLSLVADELQNEGLGIRLAQTVDLREIGLLYYVLASSETLNDALRRVERYSGINNEGVRIAYHQGKGSIAFQHVGIARLSDHHQ